MLLLLFSWVILAAGLFVEMRRGGPEGTVREYLQDLESRRVEEALGALAPETAPSWREFLEFQQFNRYEVVSIVARSPSLLESLRLGMPWRADQVTLVADVIEPSGVRWRGSTLVPVRVEGGRWLLLEPPFAPAADDG